MVHIKDSLLLNWIVLLVLSFYFLHENISAHITINMLNNDDDDNDNDDNVCYACISIIQFVLVIKKS